MNIEYLAKQAINRINSMNLTELEGKFIEHGYGYTPIRKDTKTTCGELKHDSIHCGELKHDSVHIIRATNNLPHVFRSENNNLDIAA